MTPTQRTKRQARIDEIHRALGLPTLSVEADARLMRIAREASGEIEVKGIRAA